MRALSLRTRQIIVITLLFCGYAAYYFCRADLSVATPLIIEELARGGMSPAIAMEKIGAISSYGILAYAVCKFFFAGLGDVWGGKRSFLLGLGGATLFTLLFAATGMLPVFTLAWVGNRLTQSIGWAGLIKVSSRWFNFSTYGTVLGILSLSYLVGDALARQTMGILIGYGFGWRSLFFYAAAVAGIIFVANLIFLHETRVRLGFSEPEVNPENLFAQSKSLAGASLRQNVQELVIPLLKSRKFLLVCLLSFGCTIVRETFNTWTPEYLKGHVGFSSGHAGSLSAIFPAVGAVSVLFAGWLSDRMGINGRAMLMMVGLTVSTVALVMMMGVPATLNGATLPLILIGIVAFSLLGPYSYLGGAYALDFGGGRASAASSGIIDGVGYLGGTLAGYFVAVLSAAFGWQGVFLLLAGVCALSALAAAFLYRTKAR